MLNKKTKSNKIFGFTLIQMMIALFLSVMVSFFVYTMMISSYNAYKRLSSLSKNENSIRFFTSSLENSVRYATAFSGSTSQLVFTRSASDPLSPGKRIQVRERYYFDGNGNIRNSTNVLSDNSFYKGDKPGLFKKSVIRVSDGQTLETVVVSNIVRAVYYTQDDTGKYKRLDIGVIYDDVVNGKQMESGKIERGTGTEMNEDTINRRQLCFSFRSRT